MDELGKDVAVMDGGERAQIRANTVHQNRKEVCAALYKTTSFHFLVKELRDCEELMPQPKEKCTFKAKKNRGSKDASNGVVCGCKQLLLHEMRKKQQQDEQEHGAQTPKEDWLKDGVRPVRRKTIES